MNSLLQQTKEFDNEKEGVLSDIASWSIEQLTFKPSTASWSAVEVIDHLAKVEKEMLEAWRHELPDGHPVRILERCRGLIVRWVMRSPIKITLPRGAEAVLPDHGLTLQQVSEEWHRTREVIRQMLQSLSKKQLTRDFVRHQVSGWMTPAMTLGFLRAHLQHHRYQLKRLKRLNSAVG